MKKTKRLLTSVIAIATILASAVPAFAADTDGAAAGTGGSGTASVIDSLNNISYSEYLEKYDKIPDGKGEIVIKGVDYDADATTAEVSVENGIYGEKSDVILARVDGQVTWTFDVKSAGMYNMKIDYAAVSKEGRDGETTSAANNIERVLYINGSVPFTETRLVSMKKTWAFTYTENEDGELRFVTDANGNESRPPVKYVAKWENAVLSDVSTYYIDPFEYYFKEGSNTISLQGIREDMYISKITLYREKALPTYEDVLAEYNKKGYTVADAEIIHINAETPAAVSSSTINPSYDRSSAITEPQHATAIKRNTIGGSNWATTSDWITYEVEIEKDGLYSIVTRFKQDSVPGSFVSRALKIDGEYPFAEARLCAFDYNQEWQVAPLQSNDTEFQFYLEKGKHEIQFMATVGSFGDILTRVESVADEMNDAYLQIVKLTGPYPDENRDYGFARVMPEAIRALTKCADKIDEIVKYIGEMSGGEAYNVANLESASLTLREMTESERNIAVNLSVMKSDISNLSTWCSDLESQPLMFDYIEIQPVGSALPEANAGFIDSLKYEIGQFIGSFYTDYNSYDDGTEDNPDEESVSIECWMSSGRDRATIIRDLVNSGFCAETGIGVSLKLVDAGALLPSVLAGIGPDISLDGVATIDYAIRGAVLPLNDREGFDEVCDRFYESTLIPQSLYGKTYALPTTVDFNMMFVRDDIMANLGLENPKTWEDFLALIPVLQYNNMTVIVPNDSKVFLYQAGGSIWEENDDPANEENGWRTTFDDNLTLSCFTDMCEMYTQYSLLAAADFQTRFKTGVSPVAITSYSAYTTLTVFAPEIAGLWSMNPIPGTVVGYDDEGNEIIDNTAIVTAGGISMLKGVADEEATWKFMCWYTDIDFQVDLCNELISLLGPAAKTTTANIAAMAEMPWSASEYKSLISQYEHSVGIPQYPGNYVIERYLGMAFNAAYNDGANPAEALLQYVNIANNEISRKRSEFKLPIYGENNESKE